MKLHKNQLNLIRHLIRFNILSYEDCLSFLDTENSGDMIAMSYAFRPLTKNGYVVKNRDGVVAVLQKGRELFPDEFPLISVATHGKSRLRVMQVSKVCMWMEKIGVPVSGERLDTEEPYFIPSARWRDIAKGILSTTRFVHDFFLFFTERRSGLLPRDWSAYGSVPPSLALWAGNV